MHNIELSALIIIQRVTAIKKAMKKIRKIRDKNQVIDALKTRNRSFITYDFPLNFNILVWQESYIRRIGKQTGSFKLLGIESETCKIHLPSDLTKFQSTIVKPYFVDDDNTENHFFSTVDF